MALQQVANKIGLRLSTYPYDHVSGTGATDHTLNAAGESYATIGRCMLETGAGTSKTISSAGGSIFFTLGTALTWSNAGTNLRIGIQDVDATTGLEDASYDVQADLVPGTDSLTLGTTKEAAMESGTKTIAHGDIIAVIVEMTARGGADAVTVRGYTNSDGWVFPYQTTDTGSGPTKGGTNLAGFGIKFDDGTFGWIQGIVPGVEASISINTGTTPDEVALVFRLPFEASLSGCLAFIGGVAAADHFEVIFYTDPLGTPSAAQTVTFDADLSGGASFAVLAPFTPVTLSANTDYAIAVRPTTANSISVSYLDFDHADLRKLTTLGTNWAYASRSNQSGAFSTTTDQLTYMSLYLDKFHDGTGGSGGFVGIIGGV